MKASDACFDLIKEVEGFSPTIYQDTGGVSTIGFGHVMKNKDYSTIIPPITRDTADKILRLDVFDAESVVNRQVTAILDQCEYDALVSFVFNIGGRAFSRSTMRRLINDGLKSEAADEFQKWVFDNGRRIQGLANRRAKEEALFRGERWQEVKTS